MVIFYYLKLVWSLVKLGCCFSLEHKGQVYLAQNGLKFRLNSGVFLAWWNGEFSTFNFLVI